MNYLKLFSHSSFLLLVVAGGVSISCSDELTERNKSSFNQASNQSYKISPEEALANANKFLASFDTEEQDLINPRLSSFKKKTLKASILVGTDTLKSSTVFSDDSLFYILNLDQGGYIIASADRRLAPVWGYVEQGEYNPADTTNLPLQDYLDEIRDVALPPNPDPDKPKPIEGGGDPERPIKNIYLEINPDARGGTGTMGPTEYEWVTYQEVNPLLKTKWGQGSPYNNSISHLYTGCVITATAQILAYNKKVSTFSGYVKGEHKTISMDWDGVVSYPTPAFPYREQVADLMAILGDKLNAKYTDNQTSANSEDAIKLLKRYGLNASKLGGMRFFDIMDALKKRAVIYTSGRKDKSAGHAWVIDGFRFMGKGPAIRHCYVHCNWGWSGVSNGYFLFNEYRSDHPEAIYDGTSFGTFNYTQKLRYSVVK